MALYSFTFKHGSRGKGQSASAHAKYILRVKPYDYHENHLKYYEFGNLPIWAKDSINFWTKADELEKPINARLYSEFLIALPRELVIEQQITLLKNFLRDEIGTSHPYTLAIHHSIATDKQQHPHAHLMFSTRTNDGIDRCESSYFKLADRQNPERGGAPKDRSWIQYSRLHDLRVSWQNHTNFALERAGATARVDHRSLKVQGINRIPEPRLTPFETMLWKQGIATEKVEQIKSIRKVKKYEQQVVDIEKRIRELSNFRDTDKRYQDTVNQLFTLVESHQKISNDIAEYQDRIIHNRQLVYTVALTKSQSDSAKIEKELSRIFDLSQELKLSLHEQSANRPEVYPTAAVGQRELTHHEQQKQKSRARVRIKDNQNESE